MPRPKVQPENRQRVAQACTNCKISKRKCNAELPCSHCTRKGVAHECHFVTPEERKLSATPTEQASNQAEIDEQSVNRPPFRQLMSDIDFNFATSTFTLPGRVTISQQSLPIPSHAVQSPDVSSSGTSRGQAVNTAKPRMLSTSAGERLFVGGPASLSFLQLVRDTVSRCIGASEFSEYPTRDRMLEADLHLESNNHNVSNDLDKQKQEDYIRRFFLATNGILDVVDRVEVTKLLNQSRTNDTLQTSLGLLVIAIGAQTVPLSDNDARAEKSAFSRAQKLAFAAMLENPSLDMIRIFTLLAFHMLGACRRNAAFMYLGVAARAAHALGLHHTESYKVLSGEKRQPRLRCWRSLVALDIIVSSILGRSSATSPAKQSDESMIDSIGSAQSTRPELEATFHLAGLVNAILEEFYTLKIMTVEAAESHLRKLRGWSDALPSQLRLSGLPQGGRHIAQETVLGSLQISCFYYFAVMLVTRPFLIAHLTTGLASMQDGSDAAVDAEDGPEVTELAAACLSAATFMAETCADVLNLDFMLENMCLMKAWIFAAGLVLGFHIFASKDPDVEVEQAFSSAQKVLKTFSSRSPQAAHYLDILRRLMVAIEKQKGLQTSRKRKRAASFVTRIVDLNPQEHIRDGVMTAGADTTPNYAGMGYAGQCFNDPSLIFQLDPQLLQQDMDMENMFYGWDGTSFALDDHFSAETQNSDGTGWNFTWN